MMESEFIFIIKSKHKESKLSSKIDIKIYQINYRYGVSEEWKLFREEESDD